MANGVTDFYGPNADCIDARSADTGYGMRRNRAERLEIRSFRRDVEVCAGAKKKGEICQ